MKAFQIRKALENAYTQPEWAIFFEVADGTGAASRRRADAIAMNMWPSRGLELRAFEIKVSRSDLKSELKDPSKAEAIAQYCNTFYLATPSGLTKGMDVPQNWGLIEVTEGGQARIKRQSEYNKEPDTLSLPFIASLLRSAYQSTEGVVQAELSRERFTLQQKHQESVEEEVSKHLERSRNSATQNQVFIDQLQDVLGESYRTILQDPSFLNAVRSVRELGTDLSWSGLNSISTYLKTAAEEMNKLRGNLDELSTPFKQEKAS
ncbi:MmcB family DNA repair protein [Pseudovibrio ascidiaceicola]|uniref:MmcB family DNA repair protein n=1 Tax=Pseudovibrio ascidiaceicola TaxID=285279 RepID=UPI003D35C199